MPKLDWKSEGRRFFETGVDRGVLYSTDGVGVAWNGLVAVTESPSGGDAESYYLDGQKYLNQGGAEEFEGTIEAFTYPKEFEKHDGTVAVKGLYIHEQFRAPFGLSYRTLVGNDLEGLGYAYKVHLVYNAVALPTDSEYVTQSEDDEALTFSWDFTTTPANVAATLDSKPLSHISIRSDRSTPLQMFLIENYLYGTDSSAARQYPLGELVEMFTNPPLALVVDHKSNTGLSPLVNENEIYGDLIGAFSRGIYTAPIESHLTASIIDGLYTLES